MNHADSTPALAVPLLADLEGPSRALVWALGLSVLLHAGLLTWRTAAPESFERVFADTPLEVILVNARSAQAPSDAQALAQVQLDGGGEIPEVRMATNPLPAAATTNPGDTLLERRRHLEELKSQQMRLLSQLREELASLSSDEGQAQTSQQERQQREQRRQLLSSHLAQIEERVQKTQGAPRKRYISPATRESVFALYYDKMRRLIEQQGTENFPAAAGLKLYGKLTMVMTIDRNGQVSGIEVASSSGNPLLDERARAIVLSAGPFEAFDERMRSQADQIVVVSRFKFSRDDTLETRVLAPQSGAQ
jgi:protein TonB